MTNFCIDEVIGQVLFCFGLLPYALIPPKRYDIHPEYNVTGIATTFLFATSIVPVGSKMSNGSAL